MKRLQACSGRRSDHKWGAHFDNKLRAAMLVADEFGEGGEEEEEEEEQDNDDEEGGSNDDKFGYWIRAIRRTSASSSGWACRASMSYSTCPRNS